MKAEKCFKLSVEKGYKTAYNHLGTVLTDPFLQLTVLTGRLYETRRDGLRDLAMAKQYYDLADKEGVRFAKTPLTMASHLRGAFLWALFGVACAFLIFESFLQWFQAEL